MLLILKYNQNIFNILENNMKILVIDTSSENQAFLASKITNFSEYDIDTLGIDVSLYYPEDLSSILVSSADVVIYGSGLEEKVFNLAKKVSSYNIDIEQIIFTAEEDYNSRNIRLAQYSGVRKVLSDYSPELDLLQELVSIDAERRRSGKSIFAKTISFQSANGGAGVTSIVAGVAEVASLMNKKVLIWDFDNYSADLTRGLSLNMNNGNYLNKWFNGELNINKSNFKNYVLKVDENVELATALVTRIKDSGIYSLNGIETFEQLLEVASYNYDYILIDTAKLSGELFKNIIKKSDHIVHLIGNCMLDITSSELVLSELEESLGINDKLSILINADNEHVRLIRSSMSSMLKLTEKNFKFPNLNYDDKAKSWPGSGRTIYSSGNAETRLFFETIVEKLKIGSLKIHKAKDILELPSKAEQIKIKEKKEVDSTKAREINKKVSFFRKIVNS